MRVPFWFLCLLPHPNTCEYRLYYSCTLAAIFYSVQAGVQHPAPTCKYCDVVHPRWPNALRNLTDSLACVMVCHASHSMRNLDGIYQFGSAVWNDNLFGS